MRIRELYIERFGKFAGLKLELVNGLNLIFGENEAGKSTIQHFIEGILYGFYNRTVKTRKYTALYDKYLPWSEGGGYGGSVTLEDGERSYRIVRSLLKGSDKVEVFDGVTGEDITGQFPQHPVLKVCDPAPVLLGMGRDTFVNTAAIAQLGCATGPELMGEAADKIAAMSQSMDSSLSVSDALKRLQQKADEIGTVKRSASPLGRAAAQAAALANEARLSEENEQEIAQKHMRLRRITERKEQLEQECKTLERQEAAAVYRDALQAGEELARLQERQAQLGNVSESVEQIEAAINDLEKLEHGLQQTTTGNGAVLWAVAAGIALVFGVLGLTVHPLLFTGVVLGAMPAAIAMVQRRAQKSACSSIEREIADILTQYRAGGKKELRQRLETSKAYNDAAREVAYQTEIYKRALNGRTIEELKAAAQGTETEAAPVDRAKIVAANSELEQLKMEEAALRARVDGLEQACRKVGIVKTELAEQEEIHDRLLLEIEAIEMAQQEITALSGEMHREFAPKLNSAVSDTVGKMTGGRYSRVYINREMDPKVEDCATGRPVGAGQLSSGTADLVYIAFRLGLVDLIAGGKKLPVMLDDSFAMFDDKRVERSLQAVADCADRQCLLFTCHNREKEILDRLGMEYNLIQL